MPPMEYSNFTLSRFHLLHKVLDVVPIAVPSPASTRLVTGIGSHRLHVSVLVCQLIRAALSSPQGAPLLPAIIASNIFPRVAHLALAHVNSSCMHSTLLEAFEHGVLAAMPAELWKPLLEVNFGLPSHQTSGSKLLPPLPDLIMQHGTRPAC